MTAPLDGVVVVSLEQAVAAPLATRHLADLGATVLKIERPGGGDPARHYDTKVAGQSAFFVWANRGKQSVALDLKEPGDRATFDALVAAADVFVQNLAPAAAARAHVTAAELHERYPSLIACEVSGYGLGGPRTDDKAYDLAIQAEAGAFALTGSADAMSKVGFSAADISAAMYSLSSILAALYRRAVTGEGAAISLSMLETLSEWTAPAVYAAVGTQTVPARAGHRHALIAPYGLYGLDDGRTVLIAVQAHHEWLTFAQDVLRRPALVTDERFVSNETRIANVAALEAEIDEVFGCTAADVIVDRLRAGRIAHSWVRDQLEVWGHEQHAARDNFQPTVLPTGDTVLYRSPLKISDVPEPVGRVPALDEHDPELIARLIGER